MQGPATRYTLLFTLFFTLCISSLAVCNAQRASDEPASTSGSYSVDPKTRSDLSGGKLTGRDIIRKDPIRARSSSSDQSPLQTSIFFMGATINVKIGNGMYTLGVDTLHANTWIGDGLPYLPSNSSTNTGQIFSLGYDFLVSVKGTEFTDTMELPGINRRFIQSFGSANFSDIFGIVGDVDGVMGIGMPVQGFGTLSPNESIIPTIPDSLLKNGIVPQNMTSLLITPLASNDLGRIDWGGFSDEGLTSPVQFVPIPNGFEQFWAFDVSITLGDGNQSVQIFEGQCILNSAGVSISLPNNSFQTYAEQAGAIIDDDTSYLRVDDPTKLQNMNFQIGNQMYTFTPDAQIWPRQYNSQIGGADGGTFLMVDNGTSSNDDNLCYLGSPWVQRFFVVLDGGSNSVGIANTKYTLAVLN